MLMSRLKDAREFYLAKPPCKLMRKAMLLLWLQNSSRLVMWRPLLRVSSSNGLCCCVPAAATATGKNPQRRR
uniref:Uncharacterized protein n=1 Tax=Macrostomum lignano TaxID=282301 RepID=A0A1I8FJM9_9PLAT